MDDDILLALKRALTKEDGPAELSRFMDELGQGRTDIERNQTEIAHFHTRK